MTTQFQELIQQAYSGFNERNIDKVLATFRRDVHWPKAFEGGFVVGHDAIKTYWMRQWTEINPVVEPIGFNETADGRLEIELHQIVKDLAGTTIFDGIVKHVYTVKDGLLVRMEIEVA